MTIRHRHILISGWLLVVGCSIFETKYEEIPPDLSLLTPPVLVSDSTWGWKLYDAHGNQYLFSEVRHHTSFLNLWGTWCQPCIAEMQGLQRMYDSLKTEGIELFFVTEERPDVVSRFLEEKKLTLPVFFSRDGIPTQLHTGAYPTSYVIDSNGRLLFRETRCAKSDHPSAASFVLLPADWDSHSFNPVRSPACVPSGTAKTGASLTLQAGSNAAIRYEGNQKVVFFHAS